MPLWALHIIFREGRLPHTSDEAIARGIRSPMECKRNALNFFRVLIVCFTRLLKQVDLNTTFCCSKPQKDVMTVLRVTDIH